ncbi:hypothetical protein HNP38_001689 [Chryseobacterium defluvii]|uniref:Uncharacterized protein n=1 Tax=Chryseobacterium defluvii TaxID=160396 RepID=A0A840KEL9_9FLAO|nr:hypothetical protein [Chryseobacterium defluvii]MBB4806417.1 hypothetical protein [Chryseobacterium defluvii]
MKKLFVAGAIALSVFSFAKGTDAKEDTTIKKEVSAEVKEKPNEQKKEKVALLKQWWTVTIDTPCGEVNVYFASSHADGTQEFIQDLAYAVNYSYDHCGYPGPAFELN